MVGAQVGDEALMERAIELSRQARARGDHPFGAVLADAEGRIVLEAMNTCGTRGDRTGHAERNLMTEASLRFSLDEMASMTMVTSAEPCAMCAGAAYWAGVGRIVHGLSERSLKDLIGPHPENLTMNLPCRDVLASGQRTVRVVGPILEAESAKLHEGFWDKLA